MKIVKDRGEKRMSKPQIRKGTEWFNTACTAAKRRLQNLARLLVKNPKDAFIRGKYVTVKKEFRKTIKGTKRAHEIEIIKSLEEKASDPKAFCRSLRV